jgi:hypothetical protein
LSYVVQQLIHAEYNCLAPELRFNETLNDVYWQDGKGLWEWFFNPIEVKGEWAKRSEKSWEGLSCSTSIKEDGHPWDMQRANMEMLNRGLYVNAGLYHNYIRRYFRLQHDIENEIEEQWNETIGQHRIVLGLHIRGTDRGGDWRQAKHALSLDPYVDSAEQFLRLHPDGVIFLATDDEKVVQDMKSRSDVLSKVGDKLRLRNILRGTGDDPLFATDKRKAEAKNALIDMMFLAKCDYVTHGSSELVWFALWWGGPKFQNGKAKDVESGLTWRFSDQCNLNVKGKDLFGTILTERIIHPEEWGQCPPEGRPLNLVDALASQCN